MWTITVQKMQTEAAEMCFLLTAASQQELQTLCA
jgi:hypothetical protein